MNPKDSIHRGRLFKLDEWSFRQLEPFRSSNRNIIRDYAGTDYSHFDKDIAENLASLKDAKEIIANYTLQAAEIFTTVFCSNLPRYKIKSRPNSNGTPSFARRFQIALNDLVEEIMLHHTIQGCMTDSYFRIGIAKVCMADSVAVQLEDSNWVDPGRPFVDRLYLPAWSHDMTAKHWSRIKYARDEYRVALSKLDDASIFDKSVVDKVRKAGADSKSADTSQQDGSASTIGREQETSDLELEPGITLVDYWIASERIVVTWAKGHDTNPLAVRDEDDRETGPYKILQYYDVPENTMPASPAAQLRPLMQLTNSLLRKLSEQARAQRDLPIYEPDAAEDVKRINGAKNGRWTKVARRESVDVLKLGGADQGNQGFTMFAQELLDRMGGNFTARAGLGSVAPTLGQEEIVQEKISLSDGKPQFRTQCFADSIGKRLAKLLHQDRVRSSRGVDSLEGFPDVKVPMDWTPEYREGEPEDYNICVEKYSMLYRSPEQRANQITRVINTVYLPLMQFAQQQGGNIDMRELNETLSDLLDEDTFRRLMVFDDPPENTGGSDDGGFKRTERVNTRRNIPTGGTDQSRRATMMNAMMGGGANQDQMAALSRPRA